MRLVLKANPDAQRGAITQELEALIEDPQWRQSAWSRIGLNKEQQAALSSMQPGNAAQMRQVRDVLATLARQRLQALREKLPLSNETRYTIVREFARGGMGRILIATDNAVGREVALKEVLVPHDAKTGDPSDSDPEMVERFLREAKVTGQLDHPSIVPVHEISRRQDGSIFYTMKLVRGISMAERLSQIERSDVAAPQKFAERMKLLEAFLDVCQAIAYAHSRGVIHRDLKPENIMLGSFGETVVLDWGLARVRGQQETQPADTPRFSQSLVRNASESHTLAGSVLGTPAYMSPEQASGQLNLVDERSDVYALGAILYQILAGHPAYAAGIGDTILEQVVTQPPRPLQTEAPLAPPDLVSLAAKAMARHRDARLASAELFAAEIAAFRGGRTLSVYNYSSGELLKRFVLRNKTPVAIAALALGVLATVIVLSVLSIRTERDVAQGALASRDALAEEQRIKSERMIREREHQIAEQRGVLGALDPAASTARARELEHELQSLTNEQRRLRGVNRLDVSAAVSRLLEVCTAREKLIGLALEPVAGKREELLTSAALQEQESMLARERLLGAALSALNEDFAVAELILNGTSGPKDLMDAAREAVAASRTERQRRRAARIGEIFSHIRAGKDAAGNPITSVRVQDFITEVGGWREQQTADLMIEALKPRVDSARSEPAGTIWDVRQRFEVQFIGSVLVQVGIAERAVPALAELMMALSDEEMVVELAMTLCRLEHPSAWQPLAALQRKYARESAVWTRVRRQFWRVPEPADLAKPIGADERLELAKLRLSQKRTAESVADLKQILEQHPGHQETLLTLAQVQGLIRDGDWIYGARQITDRLLAVNPGHARGLAFRASLMMYGETAVSIWRDGAIHDDGIAEMDGLMSRAVAAAPDDWWIYKTRATTRFKKDAEGEWNLDNESGLADLNEAIARAPRIPDLYYDRARFAASVAEQRGTVKESVPRVLADLNRAIDLDPENSSYWGMRAAIHRRVQDREAAARDYSRAIELDPTHIRHYESRGMMRLEMKDYRGATTDIDTLIELQGDRFPPGFAYRARIYEEMGELRDAIKWFQYYVDLRPGFAGNEPVLKTIEKLKARLQSGE